MILHIDAGNGLAIYEQVARQLKFAVARGKLRPGERVPSVRELSKQLTINPNTVSRAYRQLQDENVLEAVRGQGMRVCAAATKHCRGERKRLIGQRLRSVLIEAKQSGLSAAEIRQQLDKELATFPEHGEAEQ